MFRPALRLAPFGGLWLLGAALIVRTALLQAAPSPEAIHRLPPDTLVSVLIALLIMLLETSGLAAWFLKRDGYRSPVRWAGAFGAMLVITFFFAFGAMHANNAMFLHVLWLALIDVLLLVGAIIAAIVRAAS